LIVGYQAADTLGRRIIEHVPKVKIFGEEYSLRAEVIEMHSFSAHADHNDLVEFGANFDRTKLQNIYLVHGEPDSQDALASALRNLNFNKITIPKRGDHFSL
jgi:metallo-beta-lactamase family protein